jgi:HEAT repeat protein
MKRLAMMCLGCLSLVAGVIGTAPAQTTTPTKKVAQLIKDLKDNNATIRAAAAEELGRMTEVKPADVKPALPGLKTALKDKDANVRKAAIVTLNKAEADPKEFVPALVTMLRTDKDQGVRLAAVVTLGQIGPPAKAAIPALVEIERAGKDPKDKDKGALGKEATVALYKIRGS